MTGGTTEYGEQTRVGDRCAFQFFISASAQSRPPAWQQGEDYSSGELVEWNNAVLAFQGDFTAPPSGQPNEPDWNVVIPFNRGLSDFWQGEVAGTPGVNTYLHFANILAQGTYRLQWVSRPNANSSPLSMTVEIAINDNDACMAMIAKTGESPVHTLTLAQSGSEYRLYATSRTASTFECAVSIEGYSASQAAANVVLRKPLTFQPGLPGGTELAQLTALRWRGSLHASNPDFAEYITGYSDDTALTVNSRLDWTAVNWNTRNSISNPFSYTTTGLRVNAPGMYQIIWTSAHDIAGRPIYIAHNDTRLTPRHGTASAGSPVTLSAAMQMAANDEFRIMRDGGANHPQSLPNFSCFKIVGG